MPEFVLRPIETNDLPAICALHAESERHDGVPKVIELEELTEELQHVALETDTRVATINDDVVGYAYTYYLPSEQREERCYLFGEVHPEHRRRGVGTALVSWTRQRATEQLHSSGRNLPRFVRAETYDYITATRSLYEKMGMAPVRYNDELLRPLTDLPPIDVVDGVQIIPWPIDRDEDIRQAKNASFRDHWGSTPTDETNWHQQVRGFGARPDWSFIAVDADNQVVAHCLNTRYEADDELLGRRDGWINNLGTLAAYRGRGIASTLIAHSLHAFAKAGMTHASIGVDSANPTGAAQLYRGLGFVPVQRSITYQIEV